MEHNKPNRSLYSPYYVKAPAGLRSRPSPRHSAKQTKLKFF